MSEKKINYLSRTFDDYRSELIKFSNKYYPELADSYNDSSVGSWFIDLVSAVGDALSYHIDRAYNETSINSANMRGTMLNIARTNGLKVPGPKASMCEVELSCDLGVDPENISQPNWSYAPVVKRSTLLAAGNLNFQLTEDVDFSSQFNSDAYSNRRFTAKRDSNGTITGYTVTKSTLAVNGTTRIFKKVIQAADLKPFMEIVLPEKNVMNVESIIFKETSNFQKDPEVSEFYVDSEQYRVGNEDAYTYRFFETNSLADQYRFGAEMTAKDNEIIFDKTNPEMYVMQSGDTSAISYYVGRWKAITQKFITEYTDNGYLKVIFGSGVHYDTLPEVKENYTEYMMSNLINNEMLGILPREGWTMYIMYRVGGGISSNIGVGAINNIALTVADFKFDTTGENADTIKGRVLNSLKVTNTSTAIAGKDAPSTSELKYLIKYNTNSQERCITLKDYKMRVMMMPPKFGAPFRVATVEENNKVVMSMLTVDSYGKLSENIDNALANNILEYMSHYKAINDYLLLRSGKIYSLGFDVQLFISKTYDAPTVINNVIEKIKDYMSVDKHDMGEDIFLGDLEKEITSIDGVIAIINLTVKNNHSGSDGYSSNMYPYVMAEGSNDGDKIHTVDIESLDHVLKSDYNSMFEINKSSDITVKCKLI